MQTGLGQIKMSKYKIAIWEEISGFIEVDAESKEKAEELAEELMDEYGVEKIFYPKWNEHGGEEDLTKYKGNHTHGNREVLGCEEINE